MVTAKNYGQAVEGACTLGRRTLAASRDALIEVKYISVRQRFKYGFLYPTIRRYWKYYLYTDLQLIKRHARRLLLWVPSFSLWRWRRCSTMRCTFRPPLFSGPVVLVLRQRVSSTKHATMAKGGALRI